MLNCPMMAFWCLAHWPLHTIALEAMSQALFAVDAVQTASMGNGYYERETNCIIGHHPSRESVALFFAGAAVTHFLTENALEKVSPKLADAMEGLTIGWEGATVGWNVRIGMRF